MTRRCDSNLAQYERNRKFGHLVHVLGRSADGVKLPSVGVCLNASKAETRLDMATLLLGRNLVGRGSLGGLRLNTRPFLHRVDAFNWLHPRLNHPINQCSGPKSFVDDLCTGRGVVLGRAATTLRSIETQPFDWMICLVS